MRLPVRFPIFIVLALLLTACSPGGLGPEARGAPPTAASATPAPPALAARIHALGQGFDGDVGIAVRDVAQGWTAHYRGDEMFPQQSVAKLWVAIALLDAVDRGEARLSDVALVRREDLSVFHQPIRRMVGPNGYLTNLGKLLESALVESDNAANQVLVGRVGGPEAVQAVIDSKRLGTIRFGPGERTLQSRIAGLDWRPEYSFGWEFQRARETLPTTWRRQALETYLNDPMDGATPVAIVDALGRLKRGELLSEASTRHMLDVMAGSRTGPKRLRQGLADGWAIYHKTGTGQVLGATATGYNDVAVIVAPDGRAYAVAVMIARTSQGIPARQALMADVARAVVAHHEGRDPSAPPLLDVEAPANAVR